MWLTCDNTAAVVMEMTWHISSTLTSNLELLLFSNKSTLSNPLIVWLLSGVCYHHSVDNKELLAFYLHRIMNSLIADTIGNWCPADLRGLVNWITVCSLYKFWIFRLAPNKIHGTLMRGWIEFHFSFKNYVRWL